MSDKARAPLESSIITYERLIAKLEEYADLLGESERSLSLFAATHRYYVRPDIIKRGEILRGEIIALKDRVKGQANGG